MGSLFSKKENNLSRLEKERKTRQKYLAKEQLKLLKNISRKVLILNVQNKNNSSIIASIYNKINALILDLTNIQKSGNLTNPKINRYKRELIEIEQLWNNFLSEGFPDFRFQWMLLENNTQRNIVGGTNINYQIPNDDSYNRKKLKLHLTKRIEFPTETKINTETSREVEIGGSNRYMYGNLKILGTPLLGEFLTADTSKCSLTFSQAEIDEFFEWISGRGSLDTVLNIHNKYREFLERKQERINGNENFSIKYRVVNIINFYDHLLNQLGVLDSKIYESQEYYRGKLGWGSWFRSFFPGASSYVDYLEKVKVEDLNNLTTEIDQKISNIRYGRENFLTLKELMFSVLNDGKLVIPTQPARTDNEVENLRIMTEYEKNKQISQDFLKQEKDSLKEALTTMVTTTGGATGILNGNCE